MDKVTQDAHNEAVGVAPEDPRVRHRLQGGKLLLCLVNAKLEAAIDETLVSETTKKN